MKYTRLGDLLIDAGVITQEQLIRALAAQKQTHQHWAGNWSPPDASPSAS